VGELRTGVALLQRGKYSEPQQELLAATGHHSSAESFFYLGMADFNLHHLAAAEEALGEAWRLDPRSGSVNYNIGVVLLEQKRARDALPFLHRASTIGPGSTETAVNLVRAYLGNNQEEEGPAGIKSSLARYGQDPAFALTLGKGLLAPGLAGPARELLTTADRAAIGGVRRAAGNPAARAAEGDFQSLNVPCWAGGFGA
jgi:predicted Zn-dependent protease